jgi:hypothetical protein
VGLTTSDHKNKPVTIHGERNNDYNNNNNNNGLEAEYVLEAGKD